MRVIYMFQCGHVNGGPGRLSPLWRGFRDSPADRQQQRRGLAPAVLRVSYHLHYTGLNVYPCFRLISGGVIYVNFSV